MFRIAQGNGKKSLIFRAAIVLLAKGTFPTTKEISTTGGFAEGTIYNYFLNKDDVLLEIFLSFWINFNKKIKEIIFYLGNISSKEKLIAIFKILFKDFKENELSLYIFKILVENFPYYLSKQSKPKIESGLQQKIRTIKAERQKFFSFLDNVIEETMGDKHNSQITSQALWGACQMMLYRLCLGDLGDEKVNYNIEDIEKYMEELIAYFIK